MLLLLFLGPGLLAQANIVLFLGTEQTERLIKTVLEGDEDDEESEDISDLKAGAVGADVAAAVDVVDGL
jgi:hypothetical protein